MRSAASACSTIAARSRIDADQQVALVHRGAALGAELDHPTVGLGPDRHRARRRGLGVDHHHQLHRLRHHLAHPHARQARGSGTAAEPADSGAALPASSCPDASQPEIASAIPAAIR